MEAEKEWLLSAAEILGIPAAELQRIGDTNVVVRKNLTSWAKWRFSQGVVCGEASGQGLDRFWLKNRRRDLWRDTPTVAAVGTINVNTDSVDAVYIASRMQSNIAKCFSAFEDEKPGAPAVEHFNEIAAKLKEIEAERMREIQAAPPPDTENK